MINLLTHQEPFVNINYRMESYEDLRSVYDCLHMFVFVTSIALNQVKFSISPVLSQLNYRVQGYKLMCGCSLFGV